MLSGEINLKCEEINHLQQIMIDNGFTSEQLETASDELLYQINLMNSIDNRFCDGHPEYNRFMAVQKFIKASAQLMKKSEMKNVDQEEEDLDELTFVPEVEK